SQPELPDHIVRLGPSQPVKDGVALAKRPEGAGKIALSAKRLANFAMRNRQIALQDGIAGMGTYQLLKDRDAVAAGLERAWKIALGLLYLGDLDQRHRSIVLLL